MNFIRSIWKFAWIVQRKARNRYWRFSRGKFAEVQARFALDSQNLSKNGFAFETAVYACPIICPSGQEHLFENKLHNIHLAVAKMQGLILKPDEIFSFWNLTGQPDEKHGFRDGATFINRKVSSAVGGGLCQLSGLLYNLALLSGCEIVERYCHSIDAYGEGRYIPLGRDATVAFPRIDLCFKNPHNFSLLLKIEITRYQAKAWFFSSKPLPYQVRLEVSEPVICPSPLAASSTVTSLGNGVHRGLDGKEVDSWRIFEFSSGQSQKEFLFHSSYAPTPTLVQEGKSA